MSNVIITGSSRGIGLATAKRFVQGGCNVAFNCIVNENKMNALIEQLKSDKTHAKFYGEAADVSDFHKACSYVRNAEVALGNIDILVNNAGVEYFGLFQDMKPDEWERVMAVNFFSALNCCHAVIPSMVARKRGVIINISSVWGQIGASCEAVYAASKGALDAFTRSLAKELGPSGIRVNAIAFGAIDTDMNARLSEEEKNSFAQHTALARLGTAKEAAEVIWFLASDASSYMTGEVVNVTGGFI
jgi:3-oxoacyl-[acyl-carrier protein] reductase